MYNACKESRLPTLQVRELPEDVYNQLSYLAEKEHRSLAQQTIVLLKEGIRSRLKAKERRRLLLEKAHELQLSDVDLPDPVELVREDRER
ncbi:MAG: hypothetical protein RBT72_08195 [Spirochaetia bacterium]|jgi:hypothetical protein|nr:hypothetical protein [Spirochaetia bacterium]